jgi:hypothetical protein
VSDVRKALASRSAGSALGESRKLTRFVEKIAQALLLAPDWVQVVLRTISQMNSSLIRARQPLPFPTRSNVGLNRSRADSRPLVHI